MEQKGLLKEAKELVARGYMVLGQPNKSQVPHGTTGRSPWRNQYEQAAWINAPSFVSVRYDSQTFGLDVDTDPKAGHATDDMQALRELWAEFCYTFDFEPVRTGANTANGAGIYHFRMQGVEERDVACINVPNLDVLRKGHRFAVVRGTHPVTGNAYSGDLPPTDDLPAFTPDMLAWWLERSAPKTYKEPGAAVALDMPTPLPISKAERFTLDVVCKALQERDWGRVGGRKALLFGQTQRAAWNLAGTPQERMGKALTYVAPYVEEALHHSDRSKQQRYASLAHFWDANPGLSECLEALGKVQGVPST